LAQGVAGGEGRNAAAAAAGGGDGAWCSSCCCKAPLTTTCFLCDAPLEAKSEHKCTGASRLSCLVCIAKKACNGSLLCVLHHKVGPVKLQACLHCALQAFCMPALSPYV
jgi:hypothetical protein